MSVKHKHYLILALFNIGFFVSVLILWALCAWANTGYAVNVCTDKELEQIANFEGTGLEFSDHAADEFPKVAFRDRLDKSSFEVTYRDWNTVYYKVVDYSEYASLPLNSNRTHSIKTSRNIIDFFALRFNCYEDLKEFKTHDFVSSKQIGPVGSGYQPRSITVCTHDGVDVFVESCFDYEYYSENGIARWGIPTIEVCTYDGKNWMIFESSGGSKDGE